jgi:Cu-processing system ATP-binding protein
MIKDLRKYTNAEEYLIELFRLESFLDKKLGTLSGGTSKK